jgi:hypothetical protein
MLQLSASRRIAMDGRRLGQLELDDEILERCRSLFYDALKGGQRLSRAAMMALLENDGISTKGQRGYHILWHASQTGLICLGPMQDKQQTFVLLNEWVPKSRELSREEALVELAGRYFAGHGPATVHDFAWWAGLTVADARAGLEAAGPGLVSDERGGKAYWMARATGDPAAYGSADDSAGVYLLPGFDEYLLGYRDRGAVLAPEHAPHVVPGGNGVFQPTVVVGGRVVGTWKRRLKRDAMDITVSPFTQLGCSEARVVEAAARYSDFLGVPLSSATTDDNNGSDNERDEQSM